MTVHTQADYQIRPAGNPPTDYPAGPVPDSFRSEPVPSTFEQRRAEFIAHVLKNPAPQNTKPVWYELIRIAGGRQPHEGILSSALDFINARKDCSDFVLHGILRLLYMHDSEDPNDKSSQAHISNAILERARTTVLDFKYFPNEPGIDSLCTWTENHYILFTSAGYLAGQRYPEEVFSNSGETGRQKVELNRKRILRWLDLRFRTGFSEWLSHVYYDEDLTALLSLYDFADDVEIRSKAEKVIHLLLLDMALNSFKGVFGSTHGRAYENTKKWASHEGTTDTMKLLFGMGVYSGFDNMSAAAFALSRYRVPRAIESIARDTSRAYENRQRMGIELEEMEKWGIYPDNFEDGMHYLTLEAYLHPRTIVNTIRMFDVCNWWENRFLNNFKPYRRILKIIDALGGLPLLARLLERDVCRNTREEVNIYTYKTPDYMLSTAQDYRRGFGGDQQHIWQATLGADAVCFTTHPAKIEGVTPNYWAGSGLLPRAAQYRNVAIVIYKIEKIPALYVPIRHLFTHAWLPRDKFDELEEEAGWIFARKQDGYLALRSQQPYFWNRQDTDSQGFHVRKKVEDMNREVIAPGRNNIWVCQLGRKAEDGTFQQFVQSISMAKITFDRLKVEYQSPRNGLVRFAWDGGFYVDGDEIPLRGYPRYKNPYLHADFNTTELSASAGGHELSIRWE